MLSTRYPLGILRVFKGMRWRAVGQSAEISSNKFV